MKSFKGDFYKILLKLQNGESFAFNRFSDGELFILQNKELVLGDNLIKIGNTERTGPYTKEDHKHFDPKEHSFYRDRLLEAFKYRADNYFKGISCRCCVGDENLEWQLDILDEPHGDEYLTWANLLVNGNYPLFIAEMFPLFTEYKTVYICSEKCNLESLDFIVKDFRVGFNAMINDYHKIDEISDWIECNNIKNHLFLFSASSFAKMAIHQLYEKHPNNTYMDIGTTINAFIDMSIERVYLGDFWTEKPSPSDIYKICEW
ncbi:hypothetical protein [Halobacteriovorax sp. DPLXC-1]|uniref:hypothetical protein n=1 Tax=Halobacteriovorax sp. DPLXC-1 TaxID=3110771 RepID=UPI002FF3B38F